MGRVYLHFALTTSGRLLTPFQPCDFMSFSQGTHQSSFSSNTSWRRVWRER